MKVLLDENFPLPLYHRLRAAGHDAEHIIVLGHPLPLDEPTNNLDINSIRWVD